MQTISITETARIVGLSGQQVRNLISKKKIRAKQHRDSRAWNVSLASALTFGRKRLAEMQDTVDSMEQAIDEVS